MRFNLRAFARYRPRVLTVGLLIVIAALLALSNLSDEIRPRRQEVPQSLAQLRFEAGERDHQYAEKNVSDAHWLNVSYGWPLIWRQYVVLLPWGMPVGECRSQSRLVANLLLWLTLLVGPTVACEWLLRRYQPRLRWSMRSMFAGVAVVAVLCGWFVASRTRATLEDELINVVTNSGGDVWLDHWGPDWLDLFGAERFRRHIVGVSFFDLSATKEEHILKRLGLLSRLHYLSASIHRVTPALVSALYDIRRLRILSVEEWTPPGQSTFDEYNDDPAWCDFMAAIGEMKNLEHLDLGDSRLGNEDLHYLASLPRLKSLNIVNTRVTGAGLRELASSGSIEELALSNDVVSGVESLVTMKRLKTLHVNDVHDRRRSGDSSPLVELPLANGDSLRVTARDLESCRCATRALLRSKPKLAIDADFEVFDSRTEAMFLSDGNDISYWGRQAVHEQLRWWIDQQGAN